MHHTLEPYHIFVCTVLIWNVIGKDTSQIKKTYNIIIML